MKLEDNSNCKLGLGTFPFSNVFSEITQEQAHSIVDVFLENGGSYIETAPVYPVNKVDLKSIINSYKREMLFVSTKCVTSADADGNKVRTGDYRILINQVENELNRLGVEYLDLLQAHTIPQDVSLIQFAKNLQELKQNQPIKNIGVSNVNKEQLRVICDYCEITYVQNRFSLIHQKEQRSLEEIAALNNINFNPYQVIERGLLTSEPTNNGNWRDGDLRGKKFEYTDERYTTIRKWVEKSLIPIAEQYAISVEKLMVLWVSMQPNVSFSVIGATKPEQVSKLMPGNLKPNNEFQASLNSALIELKNKIELKFGLSIDDFRGI